VEVQLPGLLTSATNGGEGQLYPRESPAVPLDGTPGEFQSRSGRCVDAGSQTAYPSHYSECAARKESVYISHFKYKSNLKQFSNLGSQSEPGSRDSFSSLVQKCAWRLWGLSNVAAERQ